MEKIKNPEQVVASILNRNAVQPVNVEEESEASPGLFAFIPKPFGDTDKQRGGLGLLGYLLQPGEVRDIYVRSRRSSIYRLINNKITAYARESLVGVTNLTGTISIAVGSAAMVGVGTLFTTELKIGYTIATLDTGGNDVFFVVKTITDNTNVVLDEINPGPNAVTGSVYSNAIFRWFDKPFPKSKSNLADLTNVTNTVTNAPGTISIPALGTAVTGVNTLFNTAPNNLVLGDIIEFATDGPVLPSGVISEFNTVLAEVNIITNDTSISIFAPTFFTQAVTARTYRRVANVQAGTITLNPTTGAIVGVGTAFLSLSVNDSIFVNLTGVGIVALNITSITDNLNMVVNADQISVGGVGIRYALGIGTTINPSLPLLTFHERVLRPLEKFIDVTLIVPSLANRYYYGAVQKTTSQGAIELPLPANSLQGFDSGWGGRVRTPVLLPYLGIMLFRVTNNYSEPLIVNGVTFGYNISGSDQ